MVPYYLESLLEVLAVMLPCVGDHLARPLGEIPYALLKISPTDSDDVTQQLRVNSGAQPTTGILEALPGALHLVGGKDFVALKLPGFWGNFLGSFLPTLALT